MISAEEQKANQMIIAGDLAGARPILVQLCVDNPDNATYQYRAACVHDGLGLEKEALPYYQEAFKLGGLSNEDLEGAYVGLGSTYRVLGYFAKSAEVLIEGSKRFPNSQCMKIFEAMTLHESGRHNLAVAMLLHCVADKPGDASVALYRRAIQQYASEYGQIDKECIGLKP
ncbi:MAG: tetratricopeptide repeat protein [Cyanobacteria bacterium SZAS LIN-5]|nr:tetratricopeptide repeat protein [Cyanobacteria bacterium SZAS LIN-5]RTL39803.1 MAG: tetratricopeptide repeat protein [Candidatus Melainabacteria bacterium]